MALGGVTRVAAEASGAEGAGGGGGAGRYAAVVAIVPLVTVGKANASAAFRGDPLVKQYWHNVYGHAVSTQEAAAQALSPLHRLEHLSADTRMLLVHGERDPRVPREHGDMVAEAARRRGVVGMHLTYAREGHSIRREPNVLHMWHTVERFLCRVMGLPPPPALEARLVEGHTASVQWDSMGLAGG